VAYPVMDWAFEEGLLILFPSRTRKEKNGSEEGMISPQEREKKRIFRGEAGCMKRKGSRGWALYRGGEKKRAGVGPHHEKGVVRCPLGKKNTAGVRKE